MATVAPAAPVPNPAEHANEPPHRSAARHAWALLLARIYEVFPLLCPLCGAEMRIIAFITDASTVCDTLVHLGEPAAPPPMAPARAPSRWVAAGPEQDPTPDPAIQPAYEFDQRIAW